MAIETTYDPATQVHAMSAGYASILRAHTLSLGGPAVFRWMHDAKRVKNLGWLLRNAHRVNKLYRAGSLLIARLEATPDANWSGFYCCDWADESVMLEWLKRPSFREVPIYALEVV